jgi:hypothetical protein
MLPSYVKIVRVLFTPTGSHNPQFQRPYHLTNNVDNNMVDTLRQVTQEGQHITPGALAPYAGSILRPSADVYWDSNIISGWDTPRLRFMMEVEIQNQTGLVKQYMSGYTNYQGYHRNLSQVTFDPDMQLVVNRVLSLNLGTQGGIRLAGSDRVLSGEYNPTFGMGGGETVTLGLRPEDVFSIMQIAGPGNYSEPVIDGRTAFAGNTPKFSTIANDLPNQYLSRVLKGSLPIHNISASDSMATPYGDTLDRAIGHYAEMSINQNRILHQIIQNGGFQEGCSFTYKCLMEIGSNHGNLDDRVSLIEPSTNENFQMPLHQAGASANWNASNTEGIIAQVISSQVPALMSDHFLTKVAFSATNRTVTREFLVDLQGAPSSWLPTPDMIKFATNSFINRLIHEILTGLSINNAVDFNIRVMIDMYGETHIFASVMGGPEQYFCAPSFADSLTTPLLSQNVNYAMQYVSDIESLANKTVTQVANNQNPLGGMNYAHSTI